MRTLFHLANIVVLASLIGSSAFGEVVYQQDFNAALTGWSQVNYGYITSGKSGTEYQQQKTQEHPDTTANEFTRTYGYYGDADQIFRGGWRDVTAETILRFDGAPDNQPGLFVRGRGIGRASGARINSRAYYARVTDSGDGTNMQLDLVKLYNNDDNGGTNPLPAVVASGDPFALASHSTTTNRLLEITAANVADFSDSVELTATLYNGNTRGSGVLSTATFLDTGGATITRSGAVGYRTRNAGVANTRAVYDNLVVTNHSPDLLWYDSFYDDTSPRISSYYAGGIVKYWADNGQFHLNGEDAPGTAAAMIDLPDYTDDPEWEDVETKARLRIGNSTSDMVVGLANRAQGVDFTTGEGAFYYFGITGDNDANPFAALYRVVDGVATDPPLAYAPISTTVEGTNLYLSFETVTNGDGNVELTAIASKSTDLSSPFAELTYTDSSVDKLIGPGTAGMVMSKTAASSGELYNSNFDFFTVRLIPEPSTALLLLAAGLVLAGIRRQR